MLFESVACKFSQTKDMEWLCTAALNDDTNAAVALSLLVPPAEYYPTFVRSICSHPGAVRRTKEVVQIYKTLPRDQHDDVVVNACILMAKVAAVPELRAEGLNVADFVWMMPEDKAHMYTQYGLEGVGYLWKENTPALLASGGVLRTSELLAGAPLRPTKLESGVLNQLVAHRLFSAFLERRDELLRKAVGAEAKLSREAPRTARPKKTIWQAAGVQRGESELEISARQHVVELEALRGTIAALEGHQPSQHFALLQAYTPYLSAASAAALGAIYGAARGFVRAWWQDVTPSVCRELAGHAALRSAVGAALLVAAFEVAPWVRTQALEAAGRQEVCDYADPKALPQLVAIDLAYIGVIGVLNFAFPFALIPWACNPAQLLVVPAEADPPPLPS